MKSRQDIREYGGAISALVVGILITVIGVVTWLAVPIAVVVILVKAFGG